MHVNRDECFEQQRKNESAGLPEDISLPFLAYGFFKPHQLAFSQIKGYQSKIYKVKIRNVLRYVNWMPVLLEHKLSNPTVQAYLIYFKEEFCEKAYETIGYSKNTNIYAWKEFQINNKIKANVLFASDDSSLPSFIVYSGNYDWREDFIFERVIKYLDDTISRLERESELDLGHYNFNELMEIQSLYMLLWSALDRFLSFRYGKTQKANVLALSEEDFFKKALHEHSGYPYKVYSNQDLRNYELNPFKPTCSILYYYTLRNNFVHAALNETDDIKMIWGAIKDLTNIYKDVLEAVAKE